LKLNGARIIVEFTPPPCFWLVVDETGLNAYCQIIARTQEWVEVTFS